MPNTNRTTKECTTQYTNLVFSAVAWRMSWLADQRFIAFKFELIGEFMRVIERVFWVGINRRWLDDGCGD